LGLLRTVVSWTHHHHEKNKVPTSTSRTIPPSWTRRDWMGGVAGVMGTTLVNPEQSFAALPPTAPTEQSPLLRPPTTTTTTISDVGGSTSLPVATYPSAGRYYFPTLTPPFNGRATYRYTLGRNTWAFEQLLTFANVTATIRCNVIQLQETGGLWVHSPQWPTGELCHLLDELHAPVEHVILPCNAFEHKAPMKAFLQKYPTAKVWISPGQFGPLGICGTTLNEPCNMGYRVDGILGSKDDGSPTPSWANEFDIATLYVELPKNAGPVSEVAFCHRPTKTLVVTDAVVYIPSGTPPDIFSTYFDNNVIQNDSNFWAKSVLQAVFLPLRTDSEGKYPGYEAIKDRLIRAPILRALVDGRAPDAVRNWIDEITSSTSTTASTTSWDYDRIITSHFTSPISATPKDVRATFSYLFSNDPIALERDLPPVSCQDWELLDSINQVLGQANAAAPVVLDFTKGCQPTIT